MRAGARPAAASNEPLQWTNWKLLSELRIVSCMHVVSEAGKEGRGVLGNGNFWQNITAGIAAPKFLRHNSQMREEKNENHWVTSQLPLLQRRCFATTNIWKLSEKIVKRTFLLPPSSSLVWWGVSLPALPQLLSRILPWMGTFSTKLCGDWQQHMYPVPGTVPVFGTHLRVTAPIVIKKLHICHFQSHTV